MNVVMKFILPESLLLLTVAFGFWVGRSERPYNGILFNVHKLIALGTVIVAAMQIYNVLKGAGIPTLLMVAIVLAGICVVMLFASGAFLSIGNLDHKTTKAIHNIAFVLGIVDIASIIYLFSGG